MIVFLRSSNNEGFRGRRRGRRRFQPPSYPQRAPRRRPRFEIMEDRTLLAVLLVTNTDDSGPGTLRQAILNANAASEFSTIAFAIPGTGVHTIAPISPLPDIMASVSIDGTSQPGYAGTPVVELDGRNAGLANGLTIVGSGITVQGLDIVRFAGSAIEMTGPGAFNDRISSNYIGLDSSGAAGLSNAIATLITAGAHDNTVGGTDPALGNVIAYAAGSGVVVEGDDSVGNRIDGNRIVASGYDLTFDGTGGYVRLPSFPLGGGMTFEAWVESENVYASWARVFDFGDGPGSNEIDLAWNWTSGTMGLGVQDQDGNWTGIGTLNVFPQSQWVHVAVTIDSQGNAAMYWNGQEEASGVVAVPPVLARSHVSGPEQLGFRLSLGRGDARCGDLVGARTADQIRNDTTALLMGSEPGLVAYYPFNEGQGVTLHDIGPNHHDAALRRGKRQSPGLAASRWPRHRSGRRRSDFQSSGNTARPAKHGGSVRRFG